jgi:pimeloyl-ACP methyl ester carboxylesterase
MIFQSVCHEVSFWVGQVPVQADLVIPPGPGPHPAVVLVAGTGGRRDRGRWVDDVARSGIATLTWDSPGWGASPGDRAWQPPDRRTMQVLAAVDFLAGVREICPTGIGVVAADSGCWAATLAAGLSSRIAALVLLAAPCTGATWQEVHRLAQRLRARGFISAEVALAQLVLGERLRRLAAGEDAATVLAAEAACRDTPWYPWLPGSQPHEVEAFAGLAGYDPGVLLASVSCPVLGIYGSDDAATPATANASSLQAALAARRPHGGADHQVVVLPHVDDALAEPTPGVAAKVPGDWRPEVTAYVTDWLMPRIARSRRTVAPIPVGPAPVGPAPFPPAQFPPTSFQSGRPPQSPLDPPPPA